MHEKFGQYGYLTCPVRYLEVMSPVEKDHAAGLNGAVAAVLRGERAAAGLTLEELADRSGVPVVSLRRFLAGERAINVAVLHSVTQALGVEPSEVLEAAQTRLERRLVADLGPDKVAKVQRPAPADPYAVQELAARSEDE
jgi:transcriptional regulator with XRE-family HTH domain